MHAATNSNFLDKPSNLPAKLVQYKRDSSDSPAHPPMSLSAANASLHSSYSDPTNMPPPATTTTTTTTGPWNAARLFAQDRGGAPATSPSTATPAATSEPEAEHPLLFAWSFWFMHRAPGQKIDHYESAMTKIATFGSVESFWSVYSHLKRPDQVSTITDYHLFRAGLRPVWEDPANINGGKWMIRLKKGLAPRMWERLIMATVGDLSALGDQICGLVLSVRNTEDIISLWNKTAADAKTNYLIHNFMKHAMGLPAEAFMEYKAHNDSIRDTSSSYKSTDLYK